MSAEPAPRHRGEIVSAFQYGLAIFTLTALIGLANATKVFGELSRDTLLTHLHSGTLGWITMGVIGLALWIYGEAAAGAGVRTAVRASAIVTALYVAAFWSGNLYARAITGVAELAVIVGWWLWIARRAMAVGFGGLPLHQLALLLSTTVLVIGSTLGVLAQILYATGAMTPQLGARIIGGHASAQVGGYLVLTAVAIGEWRIGRSAGARTRAGLVQIYLLFAGGILYACGDIFALLPLTLVATVLQLVGMVLYVARIGRTAVGAPWTSPSGVRHLAASVPFLALSLVLLVTLVNMLGAAEGDFSRIPLGLVHALDHAMFIGVMTNVLFGAIRGFEDQPGGLADHLVFWGLNLGAASFIAVLLLIGSGSEAVRSTAPIMGVSALAGIGLHLRRLRA